MDRFNTKTDRAHQFIVCQQPIKAGHLLQVRIFLEISRAGNGYVYIYPGWMMPDPFGEYWSSFGVIGGRGGGGRNVILDGNESSLRYLIDHVVYMGQ